LSTQANTQKDLKSIVESISKQIEELSKSYNELFKKTIALAEKASPPKTNRTPSPQPRPLRSLREQRGGR